MTNITSHIEVCRLCGTENGILINIFESSPNNECITKIEAVVPDIVILRYDSLSKLICHRCVAKVKEFYQFKGICIKTQELLKSKLPWMSSNKKTASRRAVSPTIKFIEGPLAYPFEIKEPEVEVLTLSDDEDGKEISVPINVAKPSDLAQPQVKRSPGINGITSPRLQDFKKQSSSAPSFSPQPMDSVWNGNTASGMGTQNAAVRSLLASGNFDIGYRHTPEKNNIQAATARMGSSVGRGNTSTSLPSPSFRSFVQSNHAMIQPGCQYSGTALEPSGLRAAKRPRRQSLSSNPKNSGSDLSSVGRKSVITSSTPCTVATSSTVAVSSSMSKPSSVAVYPIVPNVPVSTTSTSCSVTTTSPTSKPLTLPSHSQVASVPDLSSSKPCSVATISIVGTPSPISRPSAVPALPSSTSGSFSSNVLLSPTVNPKLKPELNINACVPGGENNNNKSSVQPVKSKPKPKSKKKTVELSDTDINAISCKYPSIESVKVCGNTVVFTCTLCNKMLLTEEAIRNHECVPATCSEDEAKTKDNGHPSKNESSSVLAQNKESSCSDYVELSSDDEYSNDGEIHLCTICGRIFYSSAQLQNHVETHV